MSVSLKHYPDKPIEQSPKQLQSLDDSNNYCCQQKIDGWRVIVIFTPQKIEFLSRHNKNLTDDVEPAIKKEIQSLAKIFPAQTQLDTEWLSRRSCSKDYKLAPKLFLLDIIRYGDKWLLSTPYEDRLKLLTDDLSKTTGLEQVQFPLTAPPSTYVKFYEEQKKIPFSEGVVLKHKKFTIIGNRKECAKNPLLLKIKYRGASDGAMLMDHLRG